MGCDKSSTTAPGRHTPDIRVSGLLVRDAQALFVRQSKANATYWLLPGGGVEQGEGIEEALIREFREECSLEIDVDHRILAVIESISPDHGATRHLIQLVLPVRELTAAVPQPTDPAVLEVAWFGVEDLDRLRLHPPINGAVGDWLRIMQQHGRLPSDLPGVLTGPLWS